MQTIDWPFRADEALDAGAVTFRELRRFHAAVYPGVWAPAGVEISAAARARAAWLWSRRTGVIAGRSASAVLGTKWIEPELPAELIHLNCRPPPLLTVHTDQLLCGETTHIAGMAVTTPARTAFDVGRRLALQDGAQRVDALMNATDVKVDDIAAVAQRHPGVRGLKALRQTLEYVDSGAESPYESLTRLLLVQAGFPRPQTQIPVFDEYGRLLARIDMGWPEYLVGVDFEGAHHWTDPRQRTWDAERYTLLPELGWTDFRVTSGMLHNAPQRLLDRVGAALIARGCPKTW
ncbi:hypothetical protein [Mycolicibacterium holsaticum]|uniref:hypothetical protein n=1 Tax=Mycolicibacterium holsaticum TaxID=152142 RepID=UPI001C7D153C|nr:hypothetical protein [Mycolicibacterium holsaticum]MDA4107840.1 hypothetical protein [Mycolicibacterium holsaticum DSM 44478 = JCM 12374]QZA14718.1 hypothetical protein K3U96_11820 [Mycolicibacterium holsaticum DSM 44478 = JCM 12374]UNC07839.1 hypothetical protein H5U41_15015 [Mycolicibacterium holsaticum DSM 44478 = JCM 12374]